MSNYKIKDGTITQNPKFNENVSGGTGYVTRLKNTFIKSDLPKISEYINTNILASSSGNTLVILKLKQPYQQQPYVTGFIYNNNHCLKLPAYLDSLNIAAYITSVTTTEIIFEFPRLYQIESTTWNIYLRVYTILS